MMSIMYIWPWGICNEEIKLVITSEKCVTRILNHIMMMLIPSTMVGLNDTPDDDVITGNRI